MSDSPSSMARRDVSEVVHRLDALITSCATEEWCKVALFIARVTDAAAVIAIPVSGQLIAERIYALVESGQLLAQGNVRRWRASSVRSATRPVSI